MIIGIKLSRDKAKLLWHDAGIQPNASPKELRDDEHTTVGPGYANRFDNRGGSGRAGHRLYPARNQTARLDVRPDPRVRLAGRSGCHPGSVGPDGGCGRGAYQCSRAGSALHRAGGCLFGASVCCRRRPGHRRRSARRPAALSLSRVDVQDSSTISLPPALADVWFGCTEGAAALKIHLRIELRTGALAGPTLSDGCTHDSTVTPSSTLPSGSLRLMDLGYFGLARGEALTEQQIYWLSRFKIGTTVWDTDGRRWDLPDLLAAQTSAMVDLPVRLGQHGTLPCRLLAVRVPQEVVDQRRRRLYVNARRRGSS